MGTVFCAAAAFGLGHGAAAYGDLIAYEGFETPGDYTAGNGLEGQAGGTGFTGAWVNSGTDVALVASAGSLGYGSLPTTDGSASKLNGERAETYSHALDLSEPVFTTTNQVWMSILFQRTSGNTNWAVVLSQGNDFGVGIGGANDFTPGPQQVQAILQDNDGTVTAASDYNIGDVLFLVARITKPTTGDPTVDVWVNPGLSEDLAAVAVGGGDSTQTRGYGGLAGVNELRISAHQSQALIFDEIRVGTTLADVVPIPEPASLALLGAGAVVMGLRRRDGR